MTSLARETFFPEPDPGHRLLTAVSNAMFVTGLALIAVLMPLGQVPTRPGGLPIVSIVVLSLLFQRALLMAWERHRRQAGVWPSVGIATAFALPAVAAGVASITAFNVTVALAGAVLLASVLFRGWLLAQYVREHEFKLFENFVLWMTAVVAAFGYYQFIGDVFGLTRLWTLLKPMYSSTSAFPFPRIQSFALEPLYLAHYLLLPIGILLIRFWRTKTASMFERILLVGALGVFVLTLSRGAILGLLLSVAVLFFVTRSRHLLLYLAKCTALALVIAAVMLSLAGAVKAVKDAQGGGGVNAVNLFAEHAVSLNDGSARTRYELWVPTVKIFQNHPLTGVGPNNSGLLLDGASATTSAEAAALRSVNNDYLTYLSEMGLLGVLLTLPLIWLVLRSLRSTLRARFGQLTGPYAFALTSMALQANSFNSLLMLGTWVVIGMLIAGDGLENEKQTEPAGRPQPPPSAYKPADLVGAASA